MRYAWITMILFAASSSCLIAAEPLQVKYLRCEYLVEPLGIHETQPRLSWILESDQRGQRQTAYQVLVASSADLLNRDQGDLWDSGKVASRETAQIAYAGKPLVSRQACHWKVRSWDRNGNASGWSKPARWEMGLLDPKDWTARWIASDLTVDPEIINNSLTESSWIWCPGPGLTVAPGEPAVNRYFRCRVTVAGDAKPQKAWLILVVDDQYTLFVNGKQVAKVNDPNGWRTPNRYDLGPLLSAGDNVVAVAATNAAGVGGLCAKIVVQDANKVQHAIVSNTQWKTSDKSPEGWTTAGFDDKAWSSAIEIAPFGRGAWGNLEGKSVTPPVPTLRKALTLADKPVAKARLYATALGLYELRINGQRVGDHVLAPDWTDYRYRVRYQAYDVTSLVKPGENVLASMLAGGWYCGRIGNGGFQHWGTSPALFAQLEVTYADGSTQRVVTDGTWKVHASPLLESDFMQGEVYDARQEAAGRDGPGFDDRDWRPAVVRDEPQRSLEGQVMEPVRQTALLRPVAVREAKPGCWVFDLGQNMVGVARLKVTAPAGTKLTLRHAEMLNPDGTIYTAKLRGAPSIDTYICKGSADEVWQPTFTFHGFRYVEITGLPGKPDADTVTGVVLGSDSPRVGHFECSDPRINQLQSNISWGQRGNYLSVPTDCPQRDERLGWMGDAQVFIRTATCNADVAAFFTKWLVDVDDGQSREGGFTDVCPDTTGSGCVPAWADAGVICPWTIYQVYGDKRILERHLPAMTRWVEWCRTHSTGLIRDKDRGPDYGDWLSIGADTPKDVIGTAYFAYSTHLLAKSYMAVGRLDGALKYDQLFQDIKTAFNKRYVAADGRIQGNTQCCYAMALKFDLLPDDLRAKAAQYLDADIQAKGGHLSTGFVGVSYLLPVLTEAGKLDAAYRLLMQDTFPSWLFSVKHGATTIWERWDGWTPEKGFQDPGMNSFNHYSLGSCGQWLYDTVAGIQLNPRSPGFSHMTIRPRIGGGLSWARASLDSIHGRIASSWSLKDGVFTLEVTVPTNTSATVYMPTTDAASVTESGKPTTAAEGVKLVRTAPGAAVFAIGSGTYRFAAPMK